MGSVERQDPDYGWMLKDVGDQLDSCDAALMRMHERIRELRSVISNHVERGEGMTVSQVAELYVEFGRFFPQRVRKSPVRVDASDEVGLQ